MDRERRHCFLSVLAIVFFLFLVRGLLVSWQYCFYNDPKNPIQFLPTDIGPLLGKCIID